MTEPQASPAAAPDSGAAPPPAYSLRQLVHYFLKLGALGFGGPIALVGAMRRDLVERRGWITPADYAEGLALAQLAPGPLAAQLAIYLGWVRGRIWGATLIAGAFVLPSFLMVLALSAAYVRFGGLPWMQGVFYGVAAAVIAIIGLSAFRLVRKAAGRDGLLLAILAVNAVATAWTQTESVALILSCGALAWLAKEPPWKGKGAPGSSSGRAAPALAMAPAWLLAGLKGPATGATLWQIAGFFTAAGAFVFGSGLAIVPFLRGGVVEQFGWLTEQQFLDAVAVAMITPGPVVITVAFIGFLVAGLAGAVLAALGVFLPCYLFTVIPAPYFRRIAKNRAIAAAVEGLTAATTGAIAGAAVVLGRRAIVDVPSALIALAVLAGLMRARRVPEPVWIVAAGLVGLTIRSFTH